MPISNNKIYSDDAWFCESQSYCYEMRFYLQSFLSLVQQEGELVFSIVSLLFNNSILCICESFVIVATKIYYRLTQIDSLDPLVSLCLDPPSNLYNSRPMSEMSLISPISNRDYKSGWLTSLEIASFSSLRYSMSLDDSAEFRCRRERNRVRQRHLVTNNPQVFHLEFLHFVPALACIDW